MLLNGRLHVVFALSAAAFFILVLPAPTQAQPSGEQKKDCEVTRSTQSQRNSVQGIAKGVVGGIIRRQVGNNTALGDYRVRSGMEELVGASVAKLLDPCEREQASAATQEALSGRGGQTVSWGQSGQRQTANGSATVTRDRTKPDGAVCRVVSEVAYKNGEEVKEDVEYCQGANGWQRTNA